MFWNREGNGVNNSEGGSKLLEWYLERFLCGFFLGLRLGSALADPFDHPFDCSFCQRAKAKIVITTVHLPLHLMVQMTW